MRELLDFYKKFREDGYEVWGVRCEKKKREWKTRRRTHSTGRWRIAEELQNTTLATQIYHDLSDK